jgi:hypothetical protein
MNIKLTIEQQNRLKAASSKIHGDKRDLLSEEFINATTDKINEVLFELHNENSSAFSTVAHKDAKGKIVFTSLRSW